MITTNVRNHERYILKTGMSSINKLVFCRYYDHKRHAAKKTQKTVEAAEKVFVFVFRRKPSSCH